MVSDLKAKVVLPLLDVNRTLIVILLCSAQVAVLRRKGRPEAQSAPHDAPIPGVQQHAYHRRL